MPGLNTIPQAQQLLVDDGLVETRQGVGAFVISLEPTGREVDVVAELRAARAAIDPALAALARADSDGRAMSAVHTLVGTRYSTPATASSPARVTKLPSLARIAGVRPTDPAGERNRPAHAHEDRVALRRRRP